MVIINNNMARKIYNKNAREAHLMAEAYQRVHNEDAEDTGIESVFKQMQRAIMNGMTGKESMESLGVHPSHQRDLLAKYLEWSEEWSEGPIETGFEDAEGDWAENTPAGREDGNEPGNRNRNILGIPWYSVNDETHKMLSMAEDILGNLEDMGEKELAERGIEGAGYKAVDMLYNLQHQGWTKGSKAWDLSRKIVDHGRSFDKINPPEDAEEPRHLSALKRMQRDIMNGMTAKESMEGMMIHPSHMRDLLEEYLKWSEEWSEGPIETGFEDDPESSYDIEKRLGGGRFDHPGKTYRSGSPRVRLTRDSPGTSSVHLPEGDPRIQKYLDLGYKIVKDYKKAEQSER